MPVAIPLAIELIVILALIVSLAALMLYRAGPKKLLYYIADVASVPIKLPVIGRHEILGPLGRAVRYVADQIDAMIASAVYASDKAAGYLWQEIAKQVRWLGEFLGDLTTTLESKFGWFLLAFPPAALLVATVEAARAIPHIWDALHVLEGRATTTLTKVVNQTVQVTNVTKQYVTRVIYETVKATAGVVAAPLPWVRGRFSGIEDALGALRRRVGALEKVGLGAAAVGLTAAVLSRLGLGWIRCPRVAKAGKQVCGMDYGLLDTLLADTLLIAGTVSLIEFAGAMQGVTEEAAPLIRRFWRAV